MKADIKLKKLEEDYALSRKRVDTNGIETNFK